MYTVSSACGQHALRLRTSAETREVRLHNARHFVDAFLGHFVTRLPPHASHLADSVRLATIRWKIWNFLFASSMALVLCILAKDHY
jgi:hypothetical protein